MGVRIRNLQIVVILAALMLIGGLRVSTSAAPPAEPASAPPAQKANSDGFSFAVTADMREYSGPGICDSSLYFRGACEAIADLGDTAFMVGPGDIDPPQGVYWTITQTLGITYTWYPLPGNHETETLEDMAWLNAFDYGSVNPGPTGCPTTTYSFDYQNVHFVMLNEYCDVLSDTATTGDVPDHLYDWLETDLMSTTQEHILVFGHEPAFPQPDADNGRLRHVGDSLDQYPANRDRFWDLLKQEGVAAYICGHTHNYSAVKIDGMWQLDAGHARGIGDPGAKSTFIVIHVNGSHITFRTYRDNHDGGPYTVTDVGLLTEGIPAYLPLVLRAYPAP